MFAYKWLGFVGQVWVQRRYAKQVPRDDKPDRGTP